MQNKLNIFDALPQMESGDEEVEQVQTQKTKKQQGGRATGSLPLLSPMI